MVSFLPLEEQTPNIQRVIPSRNIKIFIVSRQQQGEEGEGEEEEEVEVRGDENIIKLVIRLLTTHTTHRLHHQPPLFGATLLLVNDDYEVKTKSEIISRLAVQIFLFFLFHMFTDLRSFPLWPLGSALCSKYQPTARFKGEGEYNKHHTVQIKIKHLLKTQKPKCIRRGAPCIILKKTCCGHVQTKQHANIQQSPNQHSPSSSKVKLPELNFSCYKMIHRQLMPIFAKYEFHFRPGIELVIPHPQVNHDSQWAIEIDVSAHAWLRIY